MTPITKLLVANRGEIATRIFKTCKEMGIATVAVFSDADEEAPFVIAADEAVALGGNSATETYLDLGKIITAATRTGATAIHPGYGFLAENAAFASACADAGIIFVGPSPATIAAMGSKIEAKKIMTTAGVPTLPTGGPNAADAIGYPLLIKASAGGGGRGMRIVRSPDELQDAVESAEREAKASFGDGTIFLEKYLPSARHIEVQILGDSYGNVVSLWERECSIQRRYQKIIEEAPSPAVDEELRYRLCEAAIAAGKASSFIGAGTVEFLFNKGKFYFLEMNTRLQVEHPVTEMITDIDLVREQILIAEGLPLSPGLEAVEIDGHSIEARIYAEDPTNGYLPQTGKLIEWKIPDTVRVDTGVGRGSVVSPHYDSMLAKVIAWGPTRTEAIRTLATALKNSDIKGVTTNRDLLVNILAHESFLAGNTNTSFLSVNDPAELGVGTLTSQQVTNAAIAIALFAQVKRRDSARTLRDLPSGWRNSPSQHQLVQFDSAEGDLEVGYRFSRDGLRVTVNGTPVDEVRIIKAGKHGIVLRVNGIQTFYRCHNDGLTWYASTSEGSTTFMEEPRFPSPVVAAPSGSLLAPMPGRVVAVKTSTGEAVTAGQVVVVIEAMKMEHGVTAPRDGVLSTVDVSEGDQVDTGQVLATLEDSE